MALCARMTSHKSVQLPWFKRCCPAARCDSLLGIAQIMSQAMSLLTMRRRNSESREADTQPGANQREGRARGPPLGNQMVGEMVNDWSLEWQTGG